MFWWGFAAGAATVCVVCFVAFLVLVMKAWNQS